MSKPIAIGYQAKHARVDFQLTIGGENTCSRIRQAVFSACSEALNTGVAKKFDDGCLATLPDCEEFTTRPVKVALDIAGASLVAEFTVTCAKEANRSGLIFVVKQELIPPMLQSMASAVLEHDAQEVLTDSAARIVEQMVEEAFSSEDKPMGGIISRILVGRR